jgi:hypothetical protein
MEGWVELVAMEEKKEMLQLLKYKIIKKLN